MERSAAILAKGTGNVAERFDAPESPAGPLDECARDSDGGRSADIFNVHAHERTRCAVFRQRPGIGVELGPVICIEGRGQPGLRSAQTGIQGQIVTGYVPAVVSANAPAYRNASICPRYEIEPVAIERANLDRSAKVLRLDTSTREPECGACQQ